MSRARPRADAAVRRSPGKRLERLGQIQDYVEVMAAQQKGIADTFHLLNDQLLTLGFTAEEEAGLISAEIDKLIAENKWDTTKW